jgi:hypothetical protein
MFNEQEVPGNITPDLYANAEVQRQSDPKSEEPVTGEVTNWYGHDAAARDETPVGELTFDEDPRIDLAAAKAAEEPESMPAETDSHKEAAIDNGFGSEADSAWTEADSVMPPKSDPESGITPEWAVPQSKMVEGDPNAPVVSSDLVNVEIASPDLIGNAQTPADTVKPVEEPEAAIPYHSMDPAMDAATNFNSEVPPIVPETKDLPTGEDIWSGKNAA